ncbi:SsrA-binding protein [Buchnera aphidicola (Melanaphis sacchari)]|uniref:SsrA-binding protein n=1 Tax=Buchnera aphidicola (Melanaphis sacchari) TaxID=2173854 RepID=A0A2U8DFE6_9GAMM|nr:SsrA-binding protein [Buchnera aphidicola (Melanaphis sacchari)]
MCINKKAYHNYFIEEIFQSGLVLHGWEIKSIRQNKINITESYINNNLREMYLCNTIIQPLNTSSNNFFCDPIRKRKLLLHKREINHLLIKKNKTGYTLVPLSLIWSKSWCKLNLALAKGKNKKDKREILKKNEWTRNKLKIIKKSLK